MKKVFSILRDYKRYQQQFFVIVAFNFLSTLMFAQEERPLFGVQRWDMYSGKGATQGQELGYEPGLQGFLKPEEWHDRAPFFCRRTADVDWVNHAANAGPLWFNYPFSQSVLQTAMDAEIDFATEAGIDFFIFNGPTRTLYSNGWELHNNLDAYLNNTREDKTKFVLALFGHNGVKYNRTKVELMLDETIEYMKSKHWQTVLGGRPLVPVLRPSVFDSQLANQASSDERMSLSEFVELIRTRAAEVGLKDPYIVGQEISKTFNHQDKLEGAGFDAMSDYAGGYGGTVSSRDEGPGYASATEAMINTWSNNFLSSTIDFVPPMAIGSYAWPRAKGEQWWHYQNPLPGELTSRVQKTFDFISDNIENCKAQVVFSYSWNEHSEGGAICPTMGESPDYTPDTRWIDEVAEGLK